MITGQSHNNVESMAKIFFWDKNEENICWKLRRETGAGCSLHSDSIL
jgi:hypothetical protein